MALVRSKRAFAILGNPVVWPAGRIVDASDPIATKYPQHFEPVESAAYVSPVVEQATAAPGEKRTTAKRAAAKKPSDA